MGAERIGRGRWLNQISDQEDRACVGLSKLLWVVQGTEGRAGIGPRPGIA